MEGLNDLAKKKYGFPGEKRNSLTVLKEIDPYPSGARRLLCKCDCGNERIVIASRFNDGTIKCCEECSVLEHRQKLIDKYQFMVGQQYGRLKVDKIYYKEGAGVVAHSICSCENHTECIHGVNYLLSGNTKSCGCYERDIISTQKHHNKYNLENEYGIGYFENGEEFIFDKEDYDLIKQYSWSMLNVRGIKYACTKRKRNGKQTSILMHRLVMGVLDNPDVEVDHIKHNTLDNRKSQLRIGTKWDNNLNHGVFVNNTSGFSGVRWDKKNQKWYATITYNKEHYWLGYYIKKEDAIRARKLAEDYYFKDWSFDNSMNADLEEDVIS